MTDLIELRELPLGLLDPISVIVRTFGGELLELEALPTWNDIELAKQIAQHYPDVFPEWEAIIFSPHTLEEGEMIHALNVPSCRICSNRHIRLSRGRQCIANEEMTLMMDPCEQDFNDTYLMSGTGATAYHRYLADVNRSDVSLVHAAWIEWLHLHPDLAPIVHQGHLIPLDTLEGYYGSMSMNTGMSLFSYEFYVRYDSRKGWHYYLIDEYYGNELCERLSDGVHDPVNEGIHKGENSLCSILKRHYELD